MADTPSPPPPDRDPRLEIPEVLRRPIDHPSLRPKPASSGPMTGMGDLAKALAIGLDFLFTTAAGGLLGWLLDRWLDLTPYGLLAGLGLGFVAGTGRLIHRTNREEREARAKRERPPGR